MTLQNFIKANELEGLNRRQQNAKMEKAGYRKVIDKRDVNGTLERIKDEDFASVPWFLQRKSQTLLIPTQYSGLPPLQWLIMVSLAPQKKNNKIANSKFEGSFFKLAVWLGFINPTDIDSRKQYTTAVVDVLADSLTQLLETPYLAGAYNKERDEILVLAKPPKEIEYEISTKYLEKFIEQKRWKTSKINIYSDYVKSFFMLMRETIRTIHITNEKRTYGLITASKLSCLLSGVDKRTANRRLNKMRELGIQQDYIEYYTVRGQVRTLGRSFCLINFANIEYDEFEYHSWVELIMDYKANIEKEFNDPIYQVAKEDIDYKLRTQYGDSQYNIWKQKAKVILKEGGYELQNYFTWKQMNRELKECYDEELAEDIEEWRDIEKYAIKVDNLL